MKPELTQLMQQASSLHRQGKIAQAIQTYQRLLAQHPALPDCWFDLGYLLRLQGQADAALLAYAQALAHGVTGPEEVHLNRAVIYTDVLRRDVEAEAELRQALRIAPSYAPALLNLGNLYEERGQRDEALGCYLQITKIVPVQGTHRHQALRAEALARMAHLQRPTTVDDTLLAQLHAAAASPPSELPASTRANVLFALGRACDELGLHDQAFAAFSGGNQNAAHGGPRYQREHAEALTSALINTFAVPTVSTAQLKSDAAQPVFICGMFRSGSTLLEQALAAHPQIQPGGELDFFPRLVATTLAPFPASMSSLNAARCAELAGQYRAYLAQRFPQSAGQQRYITDKRPDNYQLIGLIKQLFPAARFIHTVRDPRDVGLSIYMHHLDQHSLSYASKLADIGHHYGQYQRLMSHWKQLYGDSIVDFDYDQFVLTPRATLQTVLDFLELDWNPDCLEFHRLRNSVKTASYWQVRRPLYGDASGRWRAYRKHLGPLLESLQAHGVALSE
jgi:tetratricopeptide (TPR) repeat protein